MVIPAPGNQHVAGIGRPMQRLTTGNPAVKVGVVMHLAGCGADPEEVGSVLPCHVGNPLAIWRKVAACLLYTSDAADERSSVDLGGRRIIKKKQHTYNDGLPNSIK